MDVSKMQQGLFVDEAMEYQLILLLSWIMLISGFILLLLNLLGIDIQHGYGRYGDRLVSCCGAIDARLGWFIQECPCLIIPLLLSLFTRNTQLWEVPNVILVSLFILHYIQRYVHAATPTFTFTYFYRIFIFSLCIRGGKSTPILPVIIAFMFCCMNGYIQIRTHTHYYHYGSQLRPHFIIGVILFVVGMFINIQSDAILRNLRKPGEQGYKIPRGMYLHVYMYTIIPFIQYDD